MKRSFALFLSACLLVVSLAACGKDKNPPDSSLDSGSDTTQGDSTIPDGTSPTDKPRGALPDTAQETLPGGASSGTGPVVSPSAQHSGESLLKPASYEQMLRNAQVHDADGNLLDNENSYTPGVSH